MGYQVTEELAGCDSEGTLNQVEAHVVLSQQLKALLKVRDVLLSLNGLDKHVVHINFHTMDKQI